MDVSVLPMREWLAALLLLVRSAMEIVVASYHFDHPSLTQALLQRLGSRAPADVVVLVDHGAYVERACYRMRARLEELRRAGARVYLCRGDPPLGAFHMKAVVLDRRWLFTGSANLTSKSSSNVELCLRICGPPVGEVLTTLEEVRGRGQLWDGSL